MFVCVLIFICLSLSIFFLFFVLLFEIYNIQCRLLAGGHVLLNRKRKNIQVGRLKNISCIKNIFGCNKMFDFSVQWLLFPAANLGQT